MTDDVSFDQTHGTFYIAAQAQTQVFTSSGTWTKPPNAQSIRVVLIGQGAGGGSGRRGASSTIRNGGGGGAGGGWSIMDFPASQIAASVPIYVNDGTATGITTPGLGGASITTNDTSGNDGRAGAPSFFGDPNPAVTPVIYLSAAGGLPGAGGTTAPAGNAGGAADIGTMIAAAGGGGSGVSGGTGIQGGSTAGCPGGGGGGGITSGNVVSNGAMGGFPALLAVGTSSFQPGQGGGVFGTGINGLDGMTAIGGLPVPGTAAGGGQASSTAAAGHGGVGGNYGAGGGGGGASLNGFASGAGGNGGSGIAVITTYF